MLEKFFHLKENHTDVKTEIMAGITTFMTMAYILAVNPNILSAAGMDSKAVLIATALASFIATALMAVLANYPFALAPGMGLTGMMCDGAKPSCSLKLMTGVSTAVLSAMLAMENHSVSSVEGIIDDDVDKSIRNLTLIGRDGMNETDHLILKIMTSK